MFVVDSMGLFLLGRKLMQMAEGSLPQGTIATSARLVLTDVAYHPGSSITEITERIGFPQSLVSASVVKLRELGVVETQTDPSDRRRTLVRPLPAALQAKVRARAVSAEEVLAKELPPGQQGQAAEAAAALTLLARLLTPEALRTGSPHSSDQKNHT
jgi:DNA-binding MarR family transcriptional regulator